MRPTLMPISRTQLDRASFPFLEAAAPEPAQAVRIARRSPSAAEPVATTLPWRATFAWTLQSFARVASTAPALSDISRSLCEWVVGRQTPTGIQIQLRADPRRQTVVVHILAELDAATRRDAAEQARASAIELWEALGASPLTRFAPINDDAELSAAIESPCWRHARVAVPSMSIVRWSGRAMELP